MNTSTDELPLSPWWRRAALLVMIAGFAVLAFMTVMTYRKAPPIPARVVGADGAVLFTGEDILKGQEVFLKYGLMEHGTLWGHGAYLGPDYSAAYLHREAEVVSATSGAEALRVLKSNRYDAATSTLTYTAAEVAAFTAQLQEWAEYFTKGAPGQSPVFITDPAELKSLTAYFAWAAWATRAPRPGRAYSYTVNWPYDPVAGNTPTPQAYLWSAISLVFLLGGLGLVLFVFGKFNYLGWKGDPRDQVKAMAQGRGLSLTPSQRATAWYFLIVAMLFLLQTLVGGALAHYRVEPRGFYGWDLARWFPYNLLRTYHLQLAVFWIATAWVAGGLFFAPLIGGREPKAQAPLVLVLLAALAIVVFGSLGGEMLGIRNALGRLWFWIGHQGSEYLDLGRFWQVLLAAGLVFWLFLMARALWPALVEPKKRELTALFLVAATGIVLFYVPAFFYGPRTNFAVIDNWRFWIIHLWVEGFFELFATVVVALMFTHLGLTTARTAARVVYLDAILYLSGGIVGTAHHWYFTGQESLTMALGGCFSALEVVPLTLLTLDAWDFIRLQRKSDADYLNSPAAAQKWAIWFLIAVGVWNFVGAGVFGFLINMPIVSYFEMGTTLTPNHGHAAMFGVFGMLGLAVLTFCVRAMLSDRNWASVERFYRVGFWGLNIGLGLMIVLNLFPAGVLQLSDVIQHGYWHARSIEFTMSGWFHRSEWIRIIGDMVFLLAGAVPMALGTILAVLRSRKS